VVPLAWGENGFRELTNSKRPIREPNDLKGFKIRIAASPTMIDTLSALGANPTQMSWADVQPALATGAVDGQENPLQVIKYAKMNTLGQKHLSLWNHVYDPLVFAASEKTWETWTAADREIVRQTAVEAAAEQVALSRKGVQGDDALIRELEASGMEVARLTVPEKLAFRKVAQPVFDRWAANIGTELVQSAARLAAAAT
jgi:TRAP-type C4-dicarboxylate transport system substrate-binding protein